MRMKKDAIVYFDNNFRPIAFSWAIDGGMFRLYTIDGCSKAYTRKELEVAIQNLSR